MEQPKEYYAFISYKREDKKEAKRLQHALEYYRLPNHLRQENPELPEYVRPVFRDMTDLEVGELSAQIHAGLEQSHFLIVVCSPRAAASKWVNDEVEYFISLGKQDKIIPYIIEGVPHASNTHEECYPPALLNLSKEKELLGANINEMGKDSATIRIVSRMFNIRFDTLYQRYEREQRRKRWMWIVGSIFVALFGLSIGGYFVRQNGIIERQKDRLLQDSITMANQLRRISAQNDSIASRNVLILSQQDSIQNSNRLLESTNANLAQANADLFHSIQVNESKHIAERAFSLIENGDSYLARMVALQALPPIRPYTMEAERALRRAYASNSAIIEGHTNYVYCACFSPDDKRIASGSYDGSIRIWDATNGKELHTLIKDTLLLSIDSRLVPRFCLTISYSPDGRFILAGLNDGTARLWDATTFDEINRFNAKIDNVVFYNGKERKDVCNACACFNNDGSKVAVASYDGILNIWNIKNSRHQLVSAELGMPIKAVSFAPKGDIVMLISQNGDIKLYDYQKEKFIDEVRGSSADFSSDGRYIVYGGIGDHISEDIFLRDLKLNVNVDTLIGHKGSIESVRFSKDNKFIISASGDKTIKIWQVKKYFKKKWIEKWSEIETLEGHNWVVTSASFSHDGKIILSSSWDKTIRLWDTPPQGIYNNYFYDNHFATFNYKGNRILCANSYKKTNIPYVLDLNTNKKSFFAGHTKNVWSVNYNPVHNNQFVSSSSDSTLIIWDVETRKIVHTLKGHKALVWYANYSPNGHFVVSASDDETIKIWDVQTGCNLFTGYGHKGRVWSVNFSPNGKQIVSASSDGTIKVWNGKAECQKTISGSSNISARFAVFSPNGQNIAACYEDGVIKVWDSKSFKEIKAWKGHSDIVNTISFSPDSRLILSASKDKTIIVWDATQGIEMDRKVCLGEVASACFSHDGKQIVAALNASETVVLSYLPLQTIIETSQKRFRERHFNNDDEKLYY